MTLDASFVLVVCGAAWVHPALGLLVGGAYLGLLRILEWKLSSSGEAAPEAPEGTPE